MSLRRVRWWYWRHFRPAKYRRKLDELSAIVRANYRQSIIDNIYSEPPIIRMLREMR